MQAVQARAVARGKADQEQRERRRPPTGESWRRRIDRIRREDLVSYAEIARKWSEAAKRYRRETPSRPGRLSGATSPRCDGIRFAISVTWRRPDPQPAEGRARWSPVGDDDLDRPSVPRDRATAASRPARGAAREDRDARAGAAHERRRRHGRSAQKPRRDLRSPRHHGPHAHAWSHGERVLVKLTTADCILTSTGLNWFDVWTEDEYPEVHERLGE